MTGANLFAGMGSHQSARSDTDAWLTPPDLIEALGGWQSFDLDPCTIAERPWPTALQHLTEAENGLLVPWFGRVWLNPPYSNPLLGKFMARMAAHDRGTALIFARTETDAFHRHVWERAEGLLFLRGRLNFHRPDGSRAAANGGAPSVLIAYGAEDCEILSAAPVDGKFVPLRLKAQVVVDGVLPATTWAEILAQFMADRDGPVRLDELYRAFARHPRVATNQHWRDKLRQMLQRGAYERVERGVWQRRAA